MYCAESLLLHGKNIKKELHSKGLIKTFEVQFFLFLEFPLLTYTFTLLLDPLPNHIEVAPILSVNLSYRPHIGKP